MFDLAGRNVVLIQKTRPEWQAGKLNGIGGKIEDGETGIEAMIREFQEETGVIQKQWRQFIRIADADETNYELLGYYCYVETQVTDCLLSLTDEQVAIYPIADIADLPVIKNLEWLIPIAIHFSHTVHLFNTQVEPIVIREGAR
jgi:8-oxo-dGTP diphosphatase